GTYSVTVSDNNNCEFITGYSVTEPDILSLVLSSTNLSCFESNDGAVSSAVTGGIAPYTWLWSNSETSQNIDQLATGTFSVIVTDTNACSVSGELSITQPPELFVDIGPDLIIDEGTVDTLTATSGFTNYLWNTGETTMSITVSTEGYYSVTVTDSQGCTASDEMHLSVNLFNMQGIILIQGWSIFSLNISPIILPIDTLMADVVINVALVKNSFGHVWWPYFNMNQIGNHVIGEGYQAKMFFTDTLYAEGPVIVPENTPLNLLAGWSIIAYLRQQPANTEVLMSTIENSIILMKNSSGHTYWPFFNINDIGNMMPGEGYQIKLFSSVIYTYPPNSVNINKAVMVNRKTINYIFDINTGNNMTIGIPISSWSATPEIGDEIGIFTKYGELAGSSVYSGNNLSITIWGDDIITDKQELFADGENFEIRLWNKQSGLEKVLDVSWTEGSGRYSENGIAVVNKVLIAISSKFSLNNYPNPFKEICIIEFNIPENGNVRIELFNAIGEKLEMITNKEYPAGQHELQFNVGSLSVGNYFIRLETNGNTVNKAVQIIK
ncbi:MAG: T9SS type A sorting domain-containing protein, partial [Bacteroidota bacterium]|nr:T9SS type A sorting domain-containing protein [Bacteroidota bacterium]